MLVILRIDARCDGSSMVSRFIGGGNINLKDSS